MAEVEHKTRKADARGRVTLGSEYAGKEVEVVVIDSDEEQSGN